MSPHESRHPSGPPSARAVHQLLPRLAWGDAVGNQVRYLRALLRAWGYRSEIYAEQWDAECRDDVRPVRDLARESGEDDALLIHHSFESRIVPLILRAPGRKALVYHNVTPARLFEGFERRVAAACVAAREELLALRPHVSHAWGYSRFSAEELVAAGFSSVAVLPFAIDWSTFDVPVDPVLRAELDDGCANILFVGRAVPSKRVDDVLRVFTAFQRLYRPDSRLVLAGYLNRDSPHGAFLHQLRELLGAERVRFLGRVSAAQLSACFATATAYLSMSRHEGFGVPLLEAMYRGVPVVAHGAAAVPETMGGAGLTTLSDDPVEVARLLAVLDRERDLRGQVIAAQHERVRGLSQASVAEGVQEGLRPFLEGTPPRMRALPSEPEVDLVCPAFATAPDAPESRLARALAERLAGARLLTLHAHSGLGTGSPAVAPLAAGPGAQVWRFSPDQPVSSRHPSAGQSASLEAALRQSRAPRVLLGADAALVEALLPHLPEATWGVRFPPRPVPAPTLERLGRRVVEADSERLEPAVATLLQSLTHLGGLRAR